MLALDILNAYISFHPYGLAESTQAQLRYTWGAYLRHCGQVGRAVFDAQLVNEWIDSIRPDRAPDTIRTQRGNLLVVWWWAYREGIVPEAPLRVRRLRPIRHSPVAWTLDELRLLLRTAENLPKRSLFWCSLIRTAYDTALRLGDLLAIRPDQVGPTIAIIQKKTHRTTFVRLRQDTLDAILAYIRLERPKRFLWPLWGRREALYREFRLLVRRAGIRPGTFRWIRRTAVTQLERISPGAGTILAGHRARATTEMWYLDRSQMALPPLPPEIK